MIILWDHITELYNRITLWDSITEIYYRIILRYHIIELYYGIILMKRIPGIPGEPPEPPGTSRDPAGTPLGLPGTPLGPPGHPWRPSWTTKTTMSQQIPSARTLDGCIRILLLQSIIPNTSLDCFMLYTSRKEPCLIGHRAETGGDPRFQEGPDTPWRQESAHKAPGPGSPLCIIHICIYIYVHIC